MAGTTTKGLRFPTAGDNPAVHTDIFNLATDVDTELNDYVLTSAPSFTGTITLGTNANIIFEGSVDDGSETTVTVANPTADRTITFPDATGAVVLDTAQQVLTNKTLTLPIISTIVNTGTLTLPTSSGTIALTSDLVPELTNENHARATAFLLGGM